MKRATSAWVLALVGLFGCGGTIGGATDDSTSAEIRACPLMEILCPPECEQSKGGCPKQCHCPGYTACGPTLHCGVGEVCCTGPGPVSIDPSLNEYTCSPAGTVCPL